ncbi:MAG: Uma2 family endonuclease [Chloroflexi bacterium]|nr:Uma2 family endonuclease [Chloroflexota bacterium]
MTTKAQLMTAEKLLAMPDDGYRYELIRGELIRMAPAGHAHGREGNRVNRTLSNHVFDNELGETYLAETGFVIERNPDTVLAPDVAFVRKEREEAARDVSGYFPGPPDIAVEVISIHDRLTEITAKVALYLEAGTLMVIVVNPRNRTVQVHTPDGVTALTEGDTLDGGDVLPGWNMPVADIFGK